MMIVFLYAMVSFSTSQQVPIISETFFDPVCDRKGHCYECSFDEIRRIDSCYKTGFVQEVFCTLTSSSNNTQETSYMTTCNPTNPSLVSNHSIAWIVSCVFSFIFFYNWRVLKISKAQTYQNDLANIIKT